MADKKDNINIQTQETSVETTSDTDTAEDIKQEDALKTFLDRSETEEQKDADAKTKKKKLPTAAWWVIIGTVSVLLIVVAIILLLAFPKEEELPEFTPQTEVVTTVDGEGQHQATPKLNAQGKLEHNSSGTLFSYTPAQIKQIDVQNNSGTYSITATTPYTTDETTGEQIQQATVYKLVGFEDIEMQSGGPDAIANDCSLIEFIKVISLKGGKDVDYGLDKEHARAIVKTHFVDGTFSTITVGKQAPNKTGSYLKFGTNETIYLVPDDQVDGLLFSVLNLMPLEINKSADTVDNSTFSSITLSGSAFKENIVLEPNTDEAIDMPYVMVAPQSMYASDTEVSYISGAIRGLYANKAVCVNPSDSQLSKYGLKNPYAKIVATYPDDTITLVASKPNGETVNIMGESNIVYEINASYVPWVSTSTQKLVSDVVLKPAFNPLSQIVVTDASGTYTFDVTTTTDTVDVSDGTTETHSVTTAVYKDETLDSDNFYVFYSNLCAMANIGTADKNGSGKPVLTISLSYSTGRPTDTIKIYATNSTKYIAELNSKTLCLVSKNYCTNFSKCVQELINGKTVSSF